METDRDNIKIKLNAVAKILPGDTWSETTSSVISHEYRTSRLWRYFSGESRWNSFRAIKELVTAGIDLGLKEEIKEAKQGIRNFMVTYLDDTELVQAINELLLTISNNESCGDKLDKAESVTESIDKGTDTTGGEQAASIAEPVEAAESDKETGTESGDKTGEATTETTTNPATLANVTDENMTFKEKEEKEEDILERKKGDILEEDPVFNGSSYEPISEYSEDKTNEKNLIIFSDREEEEVEEEVEEEIEEQEEEEPEPEPEPEPEESETEESEQEDEQIPDLVHESSEPCEKLVFPVPEIKYDTEMVDLPHLEHDGGKSESCYPPEVEDFLNSVPEVALAKAQNIDLSVLPDIPSEDNSSVVLPPPIEDEGDEKDEGDEADEADEGEGEGDEGEEGEEPESLDRASTTPYLERLETPRLIPLAAPVPVPVPDIEFFPPNIKERSKKIYTEYQICQFQPQKPPPSLIIPKCFMQEFAGGFGSCFAGSGERSSVGFAASEASSSVHAIQPALHEPYTTRSPVVSDTEEGEHVKSNVVQHNVGLKAEKKKRKRSEKKSYMGTFQRMILNQSRSLREKWNR